MDNIAQLPGQPNQKPRLPKISPHLFEALNSLEECVARAPMTRQEHVQANQHLLLLTREIERLEAEAAANVPKAEPAKGAITDKKA